VRRLVGNVPALARHAAATVSMGGYNSVCEILAAGCPGLVVPRTTPRREQAIRAARMAALGLLDVLPADRLSVPALGDWLHAAAGGPRPSPAIRPALDGLRAIPGLADALLARGGGVGACHGGGRRAG
jgi:predicted glycosyltransferase